MKTHKLVIPAESPVKTGGKSKTAYPYNDLNDSIEVARTIHERAGGVCSADHLAEFLGYSSSRSGTFFSRIQAAKMFGLVQAQGDRLSLSERALSILSPVMPDDAARARLDAFLSIPLFKAFFDRYGTKPLPPEAGIKNALKTIYGIVPERANPAFRILMDSAEQAGLFTTAGDRTKMLPPLLSGNGQAARDAQKLPDDASLPERIEKTKSGGGGDGPPGGIHTAIIGLLRELPTTGTTWPAAKKARFLGAFKAVIDVVYPDAEETS